MHTIHKWREKCEYDEDVDGNVDTGWGSQYGTSSIQIRLSFTDDASNILLLLVHFASLCVSLLQFSEFTTFWIRIQKYFFIQNRIFFFNIDRTDFGKLFSFFLYFEFEFLIRR